jgi:putative holliday junction resolvase
MSRILALDYGLKRTGIAVTDPLQMIASGLTAVETKLLLPWLKDYFKREPVERIVIGLPLRADGSTTTMSENVDAFVLVLQKQFPDLPITTESEQNSSQEAARVMVAAGIKKKDRQDKGRLDQVAAAVILQQYMYANVWK